LSSLQIRPSVAKELEAGDAVAGIAFAQGMKRRSFEGNIDCIRQDSFSKDSAERPNIRVARGSVDGSHDQVEAS